VAERRHAVKRGYDPEMAGKRAECDGGGPVPGTHFVGRQEFTGTLTGDYIDHGDPPWRWYLMGDLAVKPDEHASEAVWCESESVFLVEAGGGRPRSSTQS
jgi:hypothetical protein